MSADADADADADEDDGGRTAGTIPTCIVTITPTATCDGAGVLPFAVTPLGDFMFLLGRSRRNQMWGAFGGHADVAKGDKTVFDVAAREFMEETLGCVRVAPAAPSTIPFRDTGLVRRLLERNYVLFTIVQQYTSEEDGMPRFYVTFVVQVPWDVQISGRFMRERRRRAASKDTTSDVLEMLFIQWWGWDRIHTALRRRHGILVDTYGTLYMLRPTVQSTLDITMHHIRSMNGKRSGRINTLIG